MRYLYPTTEQVTRVTKELALNGEASFKGTTIVESHSGWFKDSNNMVFADNIEELLLDINDFQRSYEYDAELKGLNKLHNSFKEFKKAS